MKKKYLGLSLILASAFAITLSSCGGKKGNNNNNNENENNSVVDDEDETLTYTNHKFSSGILNIGMAGKKIKSLSMMNDNYTLFIPVYDGDKVSFVKQYLFEMGSLNVIYNEIDLGRIDERYSFYYDGNDFVFSENLNSNATTAFSSPIKNGGYLNRVKISDNGEINELLTADDNNIANSWDIDITENIITMVEKGFENPYKYQYVFEDTFNFGYFYSRGEETIRQYHLKKKDDGNLVFYSGKADPTEISLLSPKFNGMISAAPTHIVLSFDNGNISSLDSYAGTYKLDSVEFEFENNRMKKQTVTSEGSGNYVFDYAYSNSKLSEIKTTLTSSTVNPKYERYSYDDKGIISEIDNINEYEQLSKHIITSYDNNYLITYEIGSNNHEYEYEYDTSYRMTTKKEYYHYMTGPSTYELKLQTWETYMYDNYGQYGNSIVAFNNTENVIGGVKQIYFYDGKRQNMGVNVFTPSGTLNNIVWTETTYEKTEQNGNVSTHISKKFSSGVLTYIMVNVNECEDDTYKVVLKNTQTTTYYEVDSTSETGYKVTKETVKTTDRISENEFKETYKEDGILKYEETYIKENNKVVEVYFTEYADNGVDVSKEYKEEYTYNDVEGWDNSTTAKHYDKISGEYVFTSIIKKNNYNEIIETYEDGKMVTKEVIHKKSNNQIDVHDIINYRYYTTQTIVDYYHIDDNEVRSMYKTEVSELSSDGRILETKVYNHENGVSTTPDEIYEYVYNDDNELINVIHKEIEKEDNVKTITITTIDSKTNEQIRKIIRTEVYDNAAFANLISAQEDEIFDDESSYTIYIYSRATGTEEFYYLEEKENGDYISRYFNKTIKNYSNHEILEIQEEYDEFKYVDGTEEYIARRFVDSLYQEGCVVFCEDTRENSSTGENYYDTFIDYTYNSDGKLSLETKNDSINNKAHQYSYQYTDEGNTVTVIYSVAGNMNKKYVRFYEDEKLMTEETYTYGSGWSLQCEATYEYNEDGNTIKFTENYGSYSYETIYTYENGNLIKTSRTKVGSTDNEFITYYDNDAKVKTENISLFYDSNDVLTRTIKITETYTRFLGLDDPFERVQVTTNYENREIVEVITDYYSKAFYETSAVRTKRITDSSKVKIDGTSMPGYIYHREIIYEQVDGSEKVKSRITKYYDENNVMVRKVEDANEFETADKRTETTTTYVYSQNELTYKTIETFVYNESGNVSSGTKYEYNYAENWMKTYTRNLETNTWEIVHN